MKIYRIAFYGLMAGALGYALYSGNRLAWLIFCLQFCTVLTAAVFNLWTVINFTYLQQLAPQRGEKGQTAQLHLEIDNEKFFPFTHMRIRVEAILPEESQDLLINLAPQEQLIRDYEITLPYRGEFKVGMTRMDFQDLFGIIPMHIDMRWLSYYRQSSITVYPRVLHLSLTPHAGKAIAGTGNRLYRREGHDELSHLKAYQPGDPASRIHWKASVKMRSLYTRADQEASGESCLIILDTRTPAGERIKQEDRLVECATALSYAYLERHDFTRIASGNPSFADPEGQSDLQNFTVWREWLALVPFENTTAESTLAALTKYEKELSPDQIYVLGAEADPLILEWMDRAAVPTEYWVAAKLPEEALYVPGNVRLASFEDQDLLFFMQTQLGGPNA
ncbi:MAG: DUF58 domain-containing protein [Firmicutes bacterium]|nr:DUF58 domain-containing protein [Bacillota bacterium]